MNPYIIGFGHSKFGRHQDKDLEDLIVQVTEEALNNANVDAKDIDEVFLGHFNEGFVDQGFTSSLVMQNQPDLRYKPMHRLENACSSGSAALQAGARAIRSGEAKRVLVVGAEKMTSSMNPGAVLARASYVKEEQQLGSFADVFAHIADKYFEAYGDKSEALALIAAKNHKNGLENPFAQLRKDLDFNFCNMVSDKNPKVSGVLKRTDCSPISDGAAALILTNDNIAKTVNRKVEIIGTSHVNDYLPMSLRNMSKLEGCAIAWQQLFAKTGLSLDDLDLVETHDCFTVAELMQYEAMGLTEYGQGDIAIKEGWTYKDGKLPVNASGGLKAKGHPVGATGVSMHIMVAKQLLEEAGGMQIANSRIGGVYNMGGSGVSSYASILRRA